MTKEEYSRAFPVVQSFHTGLWGFERIYDSVNLNRLVYKTKRAAEVARGKAYRAQRVHGVSGVAAVAADTSGAAWGFLALLGLAAFAMQRMK